MERMPSVWVPIITHRAHSQDARQKPAQLRAPPCFLGLEPQDMMEGQCVGVPVCGWVMRLFVASSG